MLRKCQYSAGDRIERLIQRSGLRWTLLRPSGFATNTLAWAPQIRAGSVVRWPFGDESRSLIHERDIAAVAVCALTGEGHAEAIHILTGPRSLTQIEQARTIGEVLGRPLRHEEVPLQSARQRLLAAWGVPGLAARILPARARVRRLADAPWRPGPGW